MPASSAKILLSVVGGTASCFALSGYLAHVLLSEQAWYIELGARLAVGSATCAVAGAIMLAKARREAARLRELLGPDADPAQSVEPKWFVAPIARVVQSVSDAWRARCDEQKVRLKEIEIRYRVAEAERDHAEGILHSLRDAVVVTDAFNEVTLANEPAARLLGFKLDEAVHKPVDQVIRDAGLRRLIKEVRSAGVAHKERHVEHQMPPAGGAPDAKHPGPLPCFDVTLAAIPAAGVPGAPGSQTAQPDASVAGVVTILRDITREKEISQMKSDFVSQASHELRTPISAINAYTEMLLDSEAQDEAGRQEFYKIIKGEAERLSRMIDNMLNISRIEAGIVSVDRVEVDFIKVIGEVVETMQAPAREKDITLSAKNGPLVYTAEADRDLVHQVIMNLVSNAIKYTPQGGRVTVSAENDDTTRSVLVTVADTGLGIPPDAIDKVFDKFYRIENYKRVAKGTGLGLNLVKQIVEGVHHGKVGVSSQVGLGSKFWFTIPYEYQGGQ